MAGRESRRGSAQRTLSAPAPRGSAAGHRREADSWGDEFMSGNVYVTHSTCRHAEAVDSTNVTRWSRSSGAESVRIQATRTVEEQETADKTEQP